VVVDVVRGCRFGARRGNVMRQDLGGSKARTAIAACQRWKFPTRSDTVKQHKVVSDARITTRQGTHSGILCVQFAYGELRIVLLELNIIGLSRARYRKPESCRSEALEPWV